MKNLLIFPIIIFLIVFIASPVRAVKLIPQEAKQIDGTVVEVPPLQPIPSGTGPNISRNIEDRGTVEKGQESLAENVNSIPETNSRPAAATSGQRNYAIIIIALVLAVALGVYFYKNRFKK